jgi:putative glutamine amidotransferase
MPSPTRRVAVLHLRTSRPAHPRFQQELDMLNASTLRTIEALGWTADLVATAEQPTLATLAAARAADMVILMGGEDVDPRLYSDNAHYPGSGHHEPRADSSQIAVVLEALQRRKPVLGLCRGAQLANVALGGTLIQHLPTASAHRAPALSGDPFIAARVVLEPDTDLHRDVDAGRPVMCTHHQAIDVLGTGLRVAGRAADGVIEAIVHDSAPITGVQWHPEHPRTAATQLMALLRRLERQLVAAEVTI